MRARTETKLRVPFERVEVTKLTTNGNALMGAISPDGKYVAYVTGESGKESLWLRQVDINSNAQLIAPREGRYLGVAFSPDGNYIYFGYAESAAQRRGANLPVAGTGNRRCGDENRVAGGASCISRTIANEWPSFVSIARRKLIH